MGGTTTSLAFAIEGDSLWAFLITVSGNCRDFDVVLTPVEGKAVVSTSVFGDIGSLVC